MKPAPMTDLYAVIGNPIAHSQSPTIHALFAESCGQDIDYGRILAPADGFESAVDEFRARGAKGMNVTAPFKLNAFTYATDPSEAAKIAGAANALKFVDDAVYAENFDGVGLVRDITVNLNVSLRDARVLILGAGGATRGALMPFVSQAPSEIVIANRDVAKAERVIAEIAPRSMVRASDYTSIERQHFDIVVNMTSAANASACPPVANSTFQGSTLAYELAYGRGATEFLRRARAGGTRHVADGVGMLVEQAAEAFAWWRGVRPQTREVIARLTVPLI